MFIPIIYNDEIYSLSTKELIELSSDDYLINDKISMIFFDDYKIKFPVIKNNSIDYINLDKLYIIKNISIDENFKYSVNDIKNIKLNKEKLKLFFDSIKTYEEIDDKKIINHISSVVFNNKYSYILKRNKIQLINTYYKNINRNNKFYIINKEIVKYKLGINNKEYINFGYDNIINIINNINKHLLEINKNNYIDKDLLFLSYILYLLKNKKIHSHTNIENIIVPETKNIIFNGYTFVKYDINKIINSL